MSNLQDLGAIGARPIWTGVRARMVHGERITMAVVELSPGGVVEAHQHDNEQMGLVIEGSVTFTIGEETRVLGPGGTWRIPSNAPHRVVAGTGGAVVVDVFSPPRADWQALPEPPASAPVWPR